MIIQISKPKCTNCESLLGPSCPQDVDSDGWVHATFRQNAFQFPLQRGGVHYDAAILKKVFEDVVYLHIVTLSYGDINTKRKSLEKFASCCNGFKG